MIANGRTDRIDTGGPGAASEASRYNCIPRDGLVLAEGAAASF